MILYAMAVAVINENCCYRDPLGVFRTVSLRAFRRFAARRSVPTHMISDNGTTFVATAEDIQKLFNSQSVREYLTHRNIQWTFIPKRAPWFGGFYERLIGVTKNTLKKTLGHALLTLDELTTLLTEVKAIINDRPIAYLSSDNNSHEPLTPAHFLCGRRVTTLPINDLSVEELQDPNFSVDGHGLRNRSKRLDQILKQCWYRWRTECNTVYLRGALCVIRCGPLTVVPPQ